METPRRFCECAIGWFYWARKKCKMNQFANSVPVVLKSNSDASTENQSLSIFTYFIESIQYLKHFMFLGVFSGRLAK